jgi:ribokinase
MKVLNFGSLNIDQVYSVDHIVREGETIASYDYRQFCGGKGLNQSVALALAGTEVYHAGKIGREGVFLIDRLKKAHVDTSFIEISDKEPTGQAIIQVDRSGQNSIILLGGANQSITEEQAEKTIEHFSGGDYLLLQNEVSSIPTMIKRAKGKGMTVFFNPAPMNNRVLSYPIELVDYFIINEVEGSVLTEEKETDNIIQAMRGKFPKAAIILTLGDEGSIYADRCTTIHIPAVPAVPVDTTAAGDTFIGYFITAIINGSTIEKSIKTATKAASICVTRKGAADSIPKRDEVFCR